MFDVSPLPIIVHENLGNAFSETVNENIAPFHYKLHVGYIQHFVENAVFMSVL